jgi:hypothetical protein
VGRRLLAGSVWAFYDPVVIRQVTCATCGARNRLKQTSGGLRAVCGRCGAALGEEGGSARGSSEASVPRMRLSNGQTLLLIGVVALALTGVAELLLIMLY